MAGRHTMVGWKPRVWEREYRNDAVGQISLEKQGTQWALWGTHTKYETFPTRRDALRRADEIAASYGGWS